jgi:hypothetical protein
LPSVQIISCAILNLEENLDSVELLSDGLGLLLLGDHNLESAEITEVSSGGLSSNLLGPRALRPLLEKSLFLPSLLQRLLCGIAGKLGSNEVGQGDSLGANDLAVNTSDGLRTINQHSLAVNNVDDCGELASIRAVVDQNNTANLNELSEWLSTETTKSN